MPPEIRDDRKNRYNCGLCLDDRHSLYSNLPNKHEMLFAFGKSGVTFARTVIQVTYLFSVIYMSSQLVFNLRKLTSQTVQNNVVYMSMHVAPLVALLLVWNFCLPPLLTTLTVITNIEMMKDNELIEAVITD
jgi:hypothetical protein